MVKRRAVLSAVGAWNVAAIAISGTSAASGDSEQESRRTVKDVRVTNDRPDPIDVEIVASAANGSKYRAKSSVTGFGSTGNVKAFDVPAEALEALEFKTDTGNTERIELEATDGGVPDWRGYRFTVRPTGVLRTSQVEV